MNSNCKKLLGELISFLNFGIPKELKFLVLADQLADSFALFLPNFDWFTVDVQIIFPKFEQKF